MNFLGMGPLELLLILALALIVFGPDRLPEIARQLGRSVNEFRRMSSDVRSELKRSLELDEQPPSRPGAGAPTILPPATPPPTQPRSGPGGDDLKPPY